MARIQGQLTVGLRGFGGSGIISARRSALAGAAIPVTGIARGAQDIANVTRRLAFGEMKRANDRETNTAENAYRDFKTDLLYGDEGLTKRQGAAAEGMTEDAATRLNEYLQDITPGLGNSVVRENIRTKVERDIAQTNDFMARHEQARLAEHAVSQAGSLYSRRQDESIQNEPERLVPGSKLFDEEVDERRSLYAQMNPAMSEGEVDDHVRAQLADDSVNAIFVMMDRSPENAPAAMQLLEHYADELDPQQRHAAKSKITDEIGFGLMQSSVADTSTAMNSNHSAKDLSEGAVKLFESRYRAMVGSAPPAEMLGEMQRQALAYDRLVQDKIKDDRDKFRADQLIQFIDTTRKGQAADVEAVYSGVMKRAIVAKDADLISDLGVLMSNYGKTQTPFADRLTTKGAELHMIPDGTVLSQDQLITAMGTMTDAEWRGWMPKHTQAYRDKMLTEDGALKVTSRTNQIAAINRYRGTRGDAALKNGDAALGGLLAAITPLDEQFVKTNGRKPNPTELDEMVAAAQVSFDDTGWDDGFTGTIGQFIANPIGQKLDLTDKRDKSIIDSALHIAKADPAVATAVNEALNGVGIDWREATAADLVDSPAIVAELLRHGLVSNRRITLDRELGPITGRRQFGVTADRKSAE